MGKKSRPSGFNSPFSDIKKLVKDIDVTTEILEDKSPPSLTEVAPQATIEERLFEEEMLGVRPLEPDPRGRLHAPARPAASRPRRGEDAEVHAALADLVDGEGSFDVSDTDEYIEGLARGIDRRLLGQLRAGEFALQGHLDLHGMTSEEARAAVAMFVTRARAEGRRCVLIIHGRGRRSKDQIPVLKERLKLWLSRGRLGRGVLAFCTARPADGGAGALYVLLRR